VDLPAREGSKELKLALLAISGTLDRRFVLILRGTSV